jgi:glycosyltransferase involved in cell wall biosynthesis
MSTSKNPKPPDQFERSSRQPYQTLKIPLKTILRDKEALPVLTHIVFDMNDLVIHTYQFIRLYLLSAIENNIKFPEINDTFILYCMKTLGERDNRGKQATDTTLLKKLEVLPNWMPSTSTEYSFLGDDFSYVDLRHTILANKKVLIYAGNLGEAQGVENFAELILSLKDQHGVGFLIIGKASRCLSYH